MALNLYGLTQPIRYPGLFSTDESLMRFSSETNYTYDEIMAKIENFKPADNDLDTARSLNELVNSSLTHVVWSRVDPATYRQLVPAWENYFLYLMGKFSSLPQFERYHFSNYKRTLERGIGQCGDASNVLSSLLNKYDLKNNIIAYPAGHVLVEYIDDNGQSHVLDPDFGVDVGVGADELDDQDEVVAAAYREVDRYTEEDIDYLVGVFKNYKEVFDDTTHFMTQRHYFEHISYVAKWLLPLAMIAFGLIKWQRLFSRRRSVAATA